jgi:hypothetical protein
MAAFWLAVAGSGIAQQKPGGSKVGWMAYRNDTPIAIMVQASVPGPNNQERRYPAHQMNPREAAWDQVSGIGYKTIRVYDAKGKELCKESVNYTGKDLFFSIQLEVTTGKGNEKITKAKVIPVPDPRTVPGFNPGAMPGPGFPGMVPPGGTMPGRPLGGIPGLTPIPGPGGPIIVPGVR